MGKEEEEEEGIEGGGLGEKGGGGSELEYKTIGGQFTVPPACVSIFFRNTKKSAPAARQLLGLACREARQGA